MSALKNFISELQRYKKIAIFGYGVEGRSFHKFAKKYLQESEIIIVDSALQKSENYLDALHDADIVIKSPGISLYNLGISWTAYNFTSITELFIKHFSKQIIGVSGTKGKSTLVTLIDSMLKHAGKKSLLCGNIGLSPLEIIEDIDAETLVVMELSSHQLHHIGYSPHIAILTNLFEEHLDYYRNKQEYFDAKFTIFSHQTSDDIFITNLTNHEDYFSKSMVNAARFYNVHNKELHEPYVFDITKGYIHHATLQILETLGEILGIEHSAYVETLAAFRTLPHRLEFVTELDGVKYINDSIATIPEATMEAIKILKDVDTLILGGYDRGVDYSGLLEFLEESGVVNIVCFSETGKQIYEKMSGSKSNKVLFLMPNLEKSLQKAAEVSQNIVLFSPAAASFNEYKNFMQRGDAFKAFVTNLRR